MRSSLTSLVLCSIAMSLAGAASAQQIGVGNCAASPQPSVGGGRFSSVKTGQQVKDPGEFYLNAYNLCRESESLAQQAMFTQAIKKGNQAERILAGIVRDYPDWRPNMVAARRNILAENIKRYREEAKNAPIPTGRQPGRAVPTEVNIPLPGIADANTPSPKRLDYTRTEMPEYEERNKELYNALALAQEECRKMAEAYKELNTRFFEVQKQLNAAKIEQSMYKERYEDLQKQIRSERDAGNKVVESLSRQLADMEEKYRNSEKARVEAETRVSELEATLAATQEELERVTRERDALKSENEQLRAIVELNSPEKTKALLDQNLTLADQLKTAQERIAMLESMMAGTDDQNTVLTQQLEEARDQANSLREEMSGVYDENRGYRRRISELTERLNNLEAELTAAADRPVVDPALAEENKLLREVIAKQRRTLAMQEEGRRLLVDTYKQIKNQDPAMLNALKKLDDESSLELTDAERRLMESIRKISPGGEEKGTDAVRRSLEVETLANLAAKAFSKGRYTSAEQLYRTLYDVQPDHVAGLVNLGTILLYRNKCEEAVEFFARAERLAPDLAISYYLAGTSYYRMDKMEEAERMFMRTVELDPANAEAFFYLANIEGISDRTDIALKHFAAAVKLKPDLGDAHYNMARLYAEKGRIPDAARAYDRAIHAGSEPDPEFENFLRNHPDNAKAPGADLVEEARPEEEAEKLRAADPEMTKILQDVAADAGESAKQQDGESEPQGAKGETAPPAPAGSGAETEARRAELQKQLDDLETRGVKAAPTPSPAGAGHVTDKKRFDDVRVRSGRRRVWLRLKRPEPQRIRPRGGEIKKLK